MVTEARIFLASSQELAADRQAFAELIRRRNDDWVSRGVNLRLVLWEDFIDAMSKAGLQDAYNQAIRGCDVFVMLFHTQVGRHTEAEFDTALGQLQATGKPFIYAYCKTAPVDPDADTSSRKAFLARLKALGHYETQYEIVDKLLLHFWQQLDKLVANGFIRFPAEGDAGTGIRYEATLHGNGALAQGPGATAVSAGAVLVQGNNSGDIITGTVAGQAPRRGPR